MWRAITNRRRPLLAAAAAVGTAAGVFTYSSVQSNRARLQRLRAGGIDADTDSIWMPRILADADPASGRPPVLEAPPALPTRSELLNALQGKAKDGSPLERDANSARDPAEFDLLIIGGGATGTGVALDAATRGLKVALVERDDFSAGTSSRSTKLVHGGVRYLEKAFMELDYEQYKLVCEALHERATFLEIAPYLAYQLPIMLPLYKWWQLPYYWAGCKAYDLLAGKEALESSYILSKTKALEAFPMLRTDDLVGALVYYDGQHNDSRMNVALALTAISHGATVANHVEVVELVKKDVDGKDVPQICAAVCRDTLTGETFTVKAKGVVNATGPFTDGIRKLDAPTAEEIVAPSAGVHIILPNYYAPADMGLLDPQTSDGRVIFFLPWQGGTIAGTTDTPTDVSANPRATEDEINWILSEVRRYLSPDVKVRRGDVLAAWSGIRPLVRDPAASSTAGLVRNHMLHVTPSGLLTIAGGKWTTYRCMAEETVDLAIETFQLEPTHAKSRTESTLLIGSHGYSKTMFIKLVQHFGLETEVAKHLASSYGDRAWAVAALARATGKSWPLFGKRLVGNYPYLEAEVRYAVRREYACTAVDVLARRTRLAFLNSLAAAQALPKVIAIMQNELGWDEARCRAEYDGAMEFLTYMGLPSPSLIEYPEGREVPNLENGVATASAGSRADLRSATRAALEQYMSQGLSQAYFTRDEVEAFRAAFANYDKDSDGSIPRGMLEALLAQVGWIQHHDGAASAKAAKPASSSSSWFGRSSAATPAAAVAAAAPSTPISADEESTLLAQVYATTGVDRKRALEFNDVLEVLVALRELRASNSLHENLAAMRDRLPAFSRGLSTERSGGGV
ncbi:mitochondrial glycerol-3-phosphate dehydrogenase [Blastocladiella emersonii ATCC 22665]|nr:mitochondrial glycerol-3-phosphate dehydrogenase [Blastocladiella emersonii ATCC 22665]